MKQVSNYKTEIVRILFIVHCTCMHIFNNFLKKHTLFLPFIYRLRNDAKCPAAALDKLRKMAVANNLFDPSRPVFALKSGKNFTKNAFNKGLELLLNYFRDGNHKITGHSFRAAIPTLISSIPDKCTVSELKEWGSWESSSFMAY